MENYDKLRILVLDDNEDSLLATVSEIGIYVNKGNIFSTVDPSSVERMILENHINTAFIDIDLGETNGFDAATRIQKTYPEVNCIFCTGHPEYALDGYDYDPLDFIVKPINLLKLERVLKKAEEALSPIADPASEKIAILTEGGFKLVDTEDIIYVEKVLRKVIIHGQNDTTVVSRYSIGQLEKIFEGYGFFKPHQSFLVPIGEIKDVHAEESMRGSFYISLKRSSAKVPLARGNLKPLKEILEARGFKFI